MKTSVNTNVKDFSSVQRALDAIKTELDKLKKRVEVNPEANESEAEGEVGSIRIIKNSLKENLFEIKTNDGWQKPVVGETLVKFTRLDSNIKISQKKSIDEIAIEDTTTGSSKANKIIFDEKADKFILPRADYDSGWTADGGGSVSHNHDLESQDFTLVQISFNNVADATTNTVYNTSGANSRAIVATLNDNNVIVVVSNGLNFHRVRIWK
jgi:hypothetical protein